MLKLIWISNNIYNFFNNVINISGLLGKFSQPIQNMQTDSAPTLVLGEAPESDDECDFTGITAVCDVFSSLAYPLHIF